MGALEFQCLCKIIKLIIFGIAFYAFDVYTDLRFSLNLFSQAEKIMYFYVEIN